MADKDVQRLFAGDYKAAGYNRPGKVVKAPLPAMEHWKKRLANQGTIKAHKPGFAERLEQSIASGIAAIGGSDGFARRTAGRTFNFLNDLTPVGDAVSAADAKAAWNRGDYLSALGNGALAALGAIPIAGDGAAKVMEMAIGPLFHVSPHKFDRFSMDHLGTGEGAQSYGKGLYFAEQPNGPTANHYRKMFGPESTTYEVQIDADPEHILDYDAPAWKQPESVRRLMQEMGMNQEMPDLPINQTPSGRFSLRNVWGESAGTFKTREAAEAKRQQMLDGMGTGTGNLLYTRLGGNPYYPHLDDGSATQRLLKEGVRGGKWRNASGEHNYVVFDDRLIDIQNRY